MMQYHRCGITGPSAPVRLATRVTHSPTVSSPETDEATFQCRLLSIPKCANCIRNKQILHVPVRLRISVGNDW